MPRVELPHKPTSEELADKKASKIEGRHWRAKIKKDTWSGDINTQDTILGAEATVGRIFKLARQRNLTAEQAAYALVVTLAEAERGKFLAEAASLIDIETGMYNDQGFLLRGSESLPKALKRGRTLHIAAFEFEGLDDTINEEFYGGQIESNVAGAIGMIHPDYQEAGAKFGDNEYAAIFMDTDEAAIQEQVEELNKGGLKSSLKEMAEEIGKELEMEIPLPDIKIRFGIVSLDEIREKITIPEDGALGPLQLEEILNGLTVTAQERLQAQKNPQNPDNVAEDQNLQ